MALSAAPPPGPPDDNGPPHDDADTPHDLVERLVDPEAKREAKRIRAAAAAKAKRKRAHDDAIAEANCAGMPVLERGSEVELAALVRDRQEVRSGGVPLVSGLGSCHRWNPDSLLWEPFGVPSVAWQLAQWDGAPICAPGKDEQEPTPLRVQERMCGAVHRLVAMEADRVFPDHFTTQGPGVAIGAEWVAIEGRGDTWRATCRDRMSGDRARWAIDATFTTDKPPALWLETVNDWWGDQADAAERTLLLQQAFGAALFGLGPRFQRALFLVGAAGSGKSVACAVLAGLFPSSAVASLSPQTLGHEYSKATLSRAAVNIAPEVPSREIMDADAFKAAVTGDQIQARDPYGRQFCARCRAFHVFAANELPLVGDNSVGFWRRVAVLDFPRAFHNCCPDRRRSERILDAERGAIVAWSVEGALSLLRSGDYCEPESSRAVRVNWGRTSNSLQAWVYARTEQVDLGDVDGWTHATACYSDFVTWCGDNGHKPLSSTSFGEKLKLLLGRDLWSHTRTGRKYAVKVGAHNV